VRKLATSFDRTSQLYLTLRMLFQRNLRLLDKYLQIQIVPHREDVCMKEYGALNDEWFGYQCKMPG
jgi:hypothetical protein